MKNHCLLILRCVVVNAVVLVVVVVFAVVIAVVIVVVVAVVFVAVVVPIRVVFLLLPCFSHYTASYKNMAWFVSELPEQEYRP